MFNIQGQVVMITGAAGGIGFAMAEQFGRLGAKLVLVAHSDGLDKLVEKHISEFKFKPLILKADLTNESDINRIVSETEKKWKKIDILINCAGVNVRKKMNEYSDEEWDWILNVNLKSIFKLSNKVAAIMKKHSYGRIINISSIQGIVCWFGNGEFALAPYCASKAALISLTKSFALDLAPYNITVNAICPGFVEGKWAKSLQDDKVLYNDIISKTPLKRFVKNSDLVGPAVFLASEESSFITGHSLLVDGGWTIQ